MLSILSHDDYAALGLTAALELGRIPYRRIERPEQHDQPLLVALGDRFSAREVDTMAGEKALVFNGGQRFAERVLGARARLDPAAAVTIPLSEPIWPPAARRRSTGDGIGALNLPRVPLCRLITPPCDPPIAWLLTDEDETSLPAVVRVGECLWSAVDLGTAFARFLARRPAPTPDGPARGTRLLPVRRPAEGLPDAAPAGVREALRALAARRLSRRLRRLSGAVTQYPGDAAGWLLLELVRGLVLRAAATAPRLASGWEADQMAMEGADGSLHPRPGAIP